MIVRFTNSHWLDSVLHHSNGPIKEPHDVTKHEQKVHTSLNGACFRLAGCMAMMAEQHMHEETLAKCVVSFHIIY